MSYTRAALAAIFGTMGIVAAASAAPLSYTGGTVTNDFNGLPTDVTNPAQLITGKGPHEFSVVTAASGMDGWQLSNLLGTGANTEFKSQNGSAGSSAGRGVISMGINGSNERALGAIPTSNQIGSWGLVLVNDSATTLDSFDLAYTGEQWRRGEPGVTNTVTFAYGLGNDIGDVLTNVASLSFSNPNNQVAPTEVALDGNLSANQVAVAGSVMGLNWQPGQTLVLRWTHSEGSGQDNGLGIDNFSFAAHPVPEPSTFVLGALAISGLAVRGVRRVRRRHTSSR